MLDPISRTIQALGHYVDATRKSSALAPLLVLTGALMVPAVAVSIFGPLELAAAWCSLVAAVVLFTLRQFGVLRDINPDLLRSESHVENKLEMEHRLLTTSMEAPQDWQGLPPATQISTAVDGHQAPVIVGGRVDDV